VTLCGVSSVVCGFYQLQLTEVFKVHQGKRSTVTQWSRGYY